jgi:hypothetical protein
MQITPFSMPGRWFRGNLHTHSTRSDGRLTPEAACAFYRERGYHFLSLTDHFMEQYNYLITDARAHHADDFITLPGAELHAGETATGELWHLLAVGLPFDFPPPSEDEDGVGIARRAVAAGAYVSVAHPAWYNLTEEDVIAMHGAGAHSIEVINGISADHNDRIDSVYMVDVMLARGYRFNLLATDDAHFKPTFRDTLRGWTWVKSEALTPEAVLAALKAGYYYSSTGPEIHDVQVVPGDEVIVRCSPANSIFLTGKGARALHQHGDDLTEVSFSIARFKSDYCRITVRDAMGGRAWTNPIALS